MMIGNAPLSAHGARRHGDAVTFLTVYLVLLCAIPSYLVIPALGSVGRLSILWGLLGFVWWVFARIRLSAPLKPGSISVKFAALTFFSVVLLSYAVAQLRGLPAGDGTTADSSLIRLLSWAGVLLVAMDGIETREQITTLIRRVVMAGALMSALGLLQFTTGQSFVDSLTLPGFAISGDFESVIDRAGFARSAATASHPLEYGVLLCMTLPLGLALGTSDVSRHWLLRWGPPAIILVAVALSMSRSAMIGVLVGLIFLAPSVPARYRIRAVVFGGILLAGLAFFVPGMIGTMRGMFTGIGTDASTTSRTDSASQAIEIALRDPWMGRGFGTFLPSELIMDNQLLLLLIECGIIGLIGFIALVVICMCAGWRVARNSGDPRDTVLGPALSAAVAAGSTTLLFFDGLAFPIAAGMLFLVYGMSGAALMVASSTPAALRVPALTTPRR
jgi:O-antigen ligase